MIGWTLSARINNHLYTSIIEMPRRMPPWNIQSMVISGSTIYMHVCVCMYVCSVPDFFGLKYQTDKIVNLYEKYILLFIGLIF